MYVLLSYVTAVFFVKQAEPFANKWSELSQRLLGSDVKLWEELFEPAFVEKVGSIIQGKLDHALDTVKQSIEQNYVKFDLKTWLWTESPNDLPQSTMAPHHSSGKKYQKFNNNNMLNNLEFFPCQECT